MTKSAPIILFSFVLISLLQLSSCICQSFNNYFSLIFEKSIVKGQYFLNYSKNAESSDGS